MVLRLVNVHGKRVLRLYKSLCRPDNGQRAKHVGRFCERLRFFTPQPPEGALITVALLSLLVCACAGGGGGAERGGSAGTGFRSLEQVSGDVALPDGVPLEQVAVTVLNSTPVQSAMTDSAGHFSFSRLLVPEGQDLSLEFTGFFPGGEEFSSDLAIPTKNVGTITFKVVIDPESGQADVEDIQVTPPSSAGGGSGADSNVSDPSSDTPPSSGNQNGGGNSKSPKPGSPADPGSDNPGVVPGTPQQGDPTGGIVPPQPPADDAPESKEPPQSGDSGSNEDADGVTGVDDPGIEAPPSDDQGDSHAPPDSSESNGAEVPPDSQSGIAGPIIGDGDGKIPGGGTVPGK